MERFKEYLKTTVNQINEELIHLLDIDTRRKKVYRREVCEIILDLINEYEKNEVMKEMPNE